MSRSVSTVKSTGWDAAIEDAKKHIDRLQTVIRVCEEKKASGEKWPGTLEQVNTSEGLISRER